MNNQRTLLLVDDEENILKSLSRTLRRDGYKILTASSGEEGLNVLGDHKVGVIVSDQRMPGMIGSEFLNRAREAYPNTVRIMLSGYTELTSVTDAINKGAIYKFLTKPWEDDLLRENIDDAFQYYELRQQNIILTNQLNEINKNLEQRVNDSTRDLQLSMRSLQMGQEVLEVLPCAVVGIDKEGMIVNANKYAHILLDESGAGMLGNEAISVLPDAINSVLVNTPENIGHSMLEYKNKLLAVNITTLGLDKDCRGIVLACMVVEKG